VEASGAPLAALVSVAPAPNAAFSAIDRVLLDVQGEETDMHGGFSRYLTTSAGAVLELRTWAGLRNGTPHVATERLSAVETQFGEHPREVALRAMAAPIVRCTMVGPNGSSVALSALGISFAPHKSNGHSGSCVWAGGPLRADGDEKGRAAKEVRFIWPRAAETLLVLGRSEATANAPSYVGEIAIEHGEDPCQIHGR
jgi:hypothetical protein